MVLNATILKSVNCRINNMAVEMSTTYLRDWKVLAILMLNMVLNATRVKSVNCRINNTAVEMSTTDLRDWKALAILYVNYGFKCRENQVGKL